MSQIVLFDGVEWEQLFPLTLTRPVCEIIIGTSTIKNKWERLLGQTIEYHCAPYLQEKYNRTGESDVILINGAVLPDEELIQAIKALKYNEAISHQGKIIAAKTNDYHITLNLDDLRIDKNHDLSVLKIVNYPEDILRLNDEILSKEINGIIADRKQKDISQIAHIIGNSDNLYIAENADINPCYLNVSNGPIYIDEGAIIMEGAMLRGPLYIGANSIIKMGSKIYGQTSIGPRCKIGGEVKRTVFFGNSNKGHEGFLGDSVIGEWCNFGADTNSSNMKNTYGLINLFDIANNRKRKTDQQFLGSIMGDHSKCAINTQFNTGTVIGVFANIFGSPPETYIPSFSWGNDAVYHIDKALEVVKTVYERRNKSLSISEESILRHIYTNYSAS